LKHFSGQRSPQGLIAGEVALTVVLLAAAGLLVRTLIHLETMPPGFNPAGVIARASVDDVQYQDPAAFRILCSGALRAMRSVLYGIGVYDVPTILVVVLTLSAVALIASTVPALRIAGIDPAKTLREE
jgi:ABC-type lipoprotein release transport system permease subunit